MARLRLNPKISVSVVYVSAMFMAIMDITIVNVALPTLGRDFHVRPAGVEAVVVAFLVSLAVFIPASGWLGDRFGTKRVLLTAIMIFTGASVLCGLAQSLAQLVLFRVLQGVGGGMLTPVGMAMLFRTFRPHERIRASRILVLPVAFAPALGPVVGGLLVTELTWRWVFFVNIPIGLFAIAFGILALDEHREPDPGRFDLAGFVLAGAGLASVMYAVSEGPFRGWGSPSIVVTGLVGGALVVGMVVVELRKREPMVDLRLFGDRLFRTTTLVFFVAVSGFLGTLFVVALFFQDGLGASPLLSGLSTFPEALGVMLGAQVATRIYPKLGPRRIIATGLTSIAAFTALMTLIGFGAYSLWEMRVLMFVLGYSMAHVFVPSQAAAFSTISRASTGRASTLFNANRQLGSAVGVAVLGTILATVGLVHHTTGGVAPNLRAYHLAFAAASVIALIGATIALTIRDSDAAPSMRKPEELAEEEAAAPLEREPVV
ncbi:MAG TPA: MDR family MFS transporter [Acidimicrobiales bacterium]|nr:MDR family MFS transporter [Acidimicrobiales bacterium]